MGDIVPRQHAQEVWDRLAEGHFTPAPLRPLDVDGFPFKVLHVPRDQEFVPGVYLKTGLPLVAWPRLAAYRHRFVLLPLENLAGGDRWAIHDGDVESWMAWSAHMDHIITFSTFKSGASSPQTLHAQSFPKTDASGTVLTALAGVPSDTIVPFGDMPHFEKLEIALLVEYPVRGLRLRVDGTQQGVKQLDRKVCEFALNYDDRKAFNLIIVPQEAGTPVAYFFPRRKDGTAICGAARWQIAGLEVSGLLQVKTEDDLRCVDSRTVRALFDQTSLRADEFASFLKLVDSF